MSAKLYLLGVLSRAIDTSRFCCFFVWRMGRARPLPVRGDRRRNSNGAVVEATTGWCSRGRAHPTKVRGDPTHRHPPDRVPRPRSAQDVVGVHGAAYSLVRWRGGR